MSSHHEHKIEEIEKFLQEKHDPSARSDLPSTAAPLPRSTRLDQLLLPSERRGQMPLTKEKYLVRENPDLIQWERETRKFLRRLSPEHAHRVAAVLVYEWATGIKIKELVAEGGSASPHLRQINRILKFYFGDSYTTYIAGRKIGKAYRIRPGYYIKKHRPLTLALWAEYRDGVLNP